jgi:hypothetical protein
MPIDDDTDALLRGMVSTAAAQGFVLQWLLNQSLLALPKPQRLKIAEGLLDASEQSEHLRGLAADDFQAERLADIVVQMQHKIDQMIGRALLATERAEGSA